MIIKKTHIGSYGAIINNDKILLVKHGRSSSWGNLL